MRRRFILFTSPTPAASESHLKSIDFNGVDEIMENTTENTIGIANAWSLMMWCKPTDTTFTVDAPIFVLDNATDLSVMSTSHIGSAAGDPFEVVLFGSTGTLFKDYLYNNLLVGAVWQQIVLTWNGTTLQLYKNASTVAPTSTPTNNAGTMTDTGRRVHIGDVGFWKGRMHSIALWSTALTAGNVTSIYNGGNGSAFDLSTVQGSSLQHWWKLGKAGDIGGDSGIGTAINVNANSVNITEADDAVTDSPS